MLLEMYFDAKEFGVRLKTIRLIYGLTQEKLAEDLNISWNHLSKIERGERRCSFELLIAISSRYGISLDYLLTGKQINEEKNRLLAVILELIDIAQSLQETGSRTNWVRKTDCQSLKKSFHRP